MEYYGLGGDEKRCDAVWRDGMRSDGMQWDEIGGAEVGWDGIEYEMDGIGWRGSDDMQ